MSIDDMYQFEQEQNKEEKTIKNTWYDWLINYISEPM